MSNAFELLLQFELEAGIVRVVVTTPADLKDHATVAFVSQREDGTRLALVRACVGSAGSMATFAADVGQGLAVGREPSGFPETGRVTALTVGICGLSLVFERLHRRGVRARFPERVFTAVTGLAGVRAYVVCRLK